MRSISSAMWYLSLVLSGLAGCSETERNFGNPIDAGSSHPDSGLSDGTAGSSTNDSSAGDTATSSAGDTATALPERDGAAPLGPDGSLLGSDSSVNPAPPPPDGSAPPTDDGSPTPEGSAEQPTSDAAPVDATTTDGGSSPLVFRVVSVTPAHEALTVEPTATITVQLSGNVDAQSVTASSFGLYDGSTRVEGTLSTSGHTITFQPAARLALLARYSIRYTDAITSSSGSPLGQAGSATFAVRDGVWSAAQKVLGPTTMYSDARIGLADDGTALMAWAEVPDRSTWIAPVQAQRWRSSGPVAPATTLATDSALQGYPLRLATNGKGEAVVAWHVHTAPETVMTRQHRGGQWDAAATCSTVVSTSQSSVMVGMSPTSRALVVWTEGDSYANYKVKAKRSNSSGAWLTESDPRNYVVTGHTMMHGGPFIPYDGTGRSFFFTEQTDAEGDSRTLVAREILPADDPWGGTMTLPGAVPYAYYPTLAFGPTGTALALWFAGAETIQYSQFDKTTGAGWGTARDLNTAVVGTIWPHVVYDGGQYWGDWVAKVSTFNKYAARLSSGSWVDTKMLSDGASYVDDGDMVADARGNLLVAWSSADQTVINVLRRPKGASEWPSAASIPLGTPAPTKAFRPQLSVGNDGRAAMLWMASNADSDWLGYISFFE